MPPEITATVSEATKIPRPEHFAVMVWNDYTGLRQVGPFYRDKPQADWYAERTSGAFVVAIPGEAQSPREGESPVTRLVDRALMIRAFGSQWTQPLTEQARLDIDPDGKWTRAITDAALAELALSQPPQGKTETVKFDANSLCKCGHSNSYHGDGFGDDCYAPGCSCHAFRSEYISPAQSPAQQGAEKPLTESELKTALAAMEIERDSWKSDSQMFSRAWSRELGTRRHKTHLIDELVVGTQELRADAEKWRAHVAEQAKSVRAKKLADDIAALDSPVDQSEMMRVVEEYAKCLDAMSYFSAARLLRAMGKVCETSSKIVDTSPSANFYTCRRTPGTDECVADVKARRELSTLIKSLNTEKQA